MRKLRYKLIVVLIVIYGFSSFLSNLLTTPLIPELFGDDQSWAGGLLKSAFQNGISLVIFTVFVIIGIREITAPVLRLSKAANKIAAGDFDVEIPQTRRRDEVGQLERSFSVMAKELKSTEVLQKNFISNVSHEYKTPLAVISGYAKLLESEGLTAGERAQYSGIIVEETTRLSQMTSNILLLSKLENQSIQPAFSRFELDEQLRQAALFYLPKCQEKHITLEVDAPPVVAHGNEELLMHVWTNLIGNAVKFAGEGGVIHVEACENASGIITTVRDDGEGMDDATKARIFDQFYQGDTSRATAGNGLGLTLVLRIVQTHQGEIRVDSEPGQGAVFTVTLPHAQH